MLGILTFGGWEILRLGVKNSFVWWLVFLRLGVRNSYVWGLVFLRLGLVFLRLRVRNSSVCGLGILTFRGLVFVTFGG